MLSLKITTNKTFRMDEIESCMKLDNKPNHIDYSFSDPEDEEKKFAYFEVVISGQKKTLAVSGKVEVLSRVDNEILEDTWEKEK